MEFPVPAISLQNLSKTFFDRQNKPVEVVSNLSLNIQKNETLCLIGTSGCGKTTTLKMINRLVEPSQGTITLEGKEIGKMDPVQLRRSIGYVIQTGGLFPHLKVNENISLLCQLEKWPSEKIRLRIVELLSLVNLSPSEFSHRYPRELSGGQRQRVGVARALALDPPFVLMDEPFGALDPFTRAQLHKEFLQLKRNLNKTIILVTHDMDEAFKLGNRVALMDQGKILQVGTEKEFRKNPRNEFVREFFRAHVNCGSEA